MIFSFFVLVCSIKCYVCHSKSDEPCYTDPKHGEFEKECSPKRIIDSVFTFRDTLNSTLQADISTMKGNIYVNHDFFQVDISIVA